VSFVVGFGRFWWDFVIGDDWRIAAGVAVVLAGGAVLVGGTGLSDTAVTLLAGAGILVVVAASIVGGTIASLKGR
jgi:hypothetical protein